MFRVLVFRRSGVPEFRRSGIPPFHILVQAESDFGTTDTAQTPPANHSQCSSPVEALNLIVESKSQPAKLHNLTIGLHVPSRRKKSLQSYCFVDFDFLDLMQFDMTFDVTLRDDSSFGKVTNSCNENVSFSLLLVMFSITEINR